MCSENNDLTENSQAVIAYLNIMQSIIQRMASNSASCKTWCITLVSAILVLAIDKSKQPWCALIALIPISLFLFLDTYYLFLEKSFRESYKSFIEKLHQGKVVVTDLFAINPPSPITFAMLKSSLKSHAIWPFYLALGAVIMIVLIVFVKECPNTQLLGK